MAWREGQRVYCAGNLNDRGTITVGHDGRPTVLWDDGHADDLWGAMSTEVVGYPLRAYALQPGTPDVAPPTLAQGWLAWAERSEVTGA